MDNAQTVNYHHLDNGYFHSEGAPVRGLLTTQCSGGK